MKKRPKRTARDGLHNILLDCRFLKIGGAGRATELLLRGLQEIGPPGHWILWGSDEVQRHLWEGAEWRRNSASPTAIWGQRSIFSVPRHDVAIYMHQVRPLVPGRALTVIHDTIPLRYGSARWARIAKRIYLLTVARLSTLIVTVSYHSARSIEHDLHVPASDIRVVQYPVDHEMVQRVREIRRTSAMEERVLYVGRFAPHKNLFRLLQAFPRTRFSRDGGKLLLVGGDRREVEEVTRFASDWSIENVQIMGRCSDRELEELYATSRLLVLPSLEEGFGLPVWEALSCELRVCVSDAGSLPEIASTAVRFSPTSVHAIAEAIDRALSNPAPVPPAKPDVATYAADFVNLVNQLL